MGSDEESEKSADYGNEVYNVLRKSKIRCEMDRRNEKKGYRLEKHSCSTVYRI